MLAHPNVDVSHRDLAGNNLLHHAYTRYPQSEEVLEILLKAGADPDMPNYLGLTPSDLRYAV